MVTQAIAFQEKATTETSPAPARPISITVPEFHHSVRSVSHCFKKSEHILTIGIETDRPLSSPAKILTLETVGSVQTQRYTFDLSGQECCHHTISDIRLCFEPSDTQYIHRIEIDGAPVEGVIARIPGALKWKVVSAASLRASYH